VASHCCPFRKNYVVHRIPVDRLYMTAYAAQTDWTPHKTVLIAVVTVASASIMALIDELALDRR
jgi:hypothetical protein